MTPYFDEEINQGRSWTFYIFIIFILVGCIAFIVYLVKDKDKDKTNISPVQKIKSVFHYNNDFSSSSIKGSDLSSQYPDPVVNNSLNRAINNHRAEEKITHTYYANDEPDGKKWCYVGEYDDVRSCRSLENQDVCMSGNIFPSRDICINPNLR